MAQEKIVEIDLREISVGLEGVRTGDWTVSYDMDWDNGHAQFRELVTSIEQIGQIEPGIVRYNQSDSKHEWELVVGFRRFAALKLLWERDDNRRKFRAIVRDLDEKKTLETMIASNMRAPLDSADLAFAIERYATLAQEDEADSRFADRLGIDRGYALSLLRLVRLAPKIAKKWQHESIRITLAEMLQIANLKTEAAQAGAYEKAVQANDYQSEETAEETRLSEIAEELKNLADRLVG